MDPSSFGREAPLDITRDLSAQVGDQGSPADAPTAPLVSLGEEGRHLPDTLDVVIGDGDVRGRAASARTCRAFVPPRIRGKREPGHGVGRVHQDLPPVHVQVRSPQIHQGRHRVDVPRRHGGRGRRFVVESDVGECDDTTEPTRKRLAQDSWCLSPGARPAQPLGDVRAGDGQQVRGAVLGGDAAEVCGKAVLRPAQLTDDGLQPEVACRRHGDSPSRNDL